MIPEIDRWENTNFDVADAALRRTHPAIHAELFQNLGISTASPAKTGEPEAPAAE